MASPQRTVSLSQRAVGMVGSIHTCNIENFNLQSVLTWISYLRSFVEFSFFLSLQVAIDGRSTRTSHQVDQEYGKVKGIYYHPRKPQ
jgi:hypothetical protein